MDMTNRHQPSVMHLFTNDMNGVNEGPPSRVNRGGLQKQRKRPKRGCQMGRYVEGQSQTISLNRPRGDIVKFEKVLRRNMESLATPM